MNILPADTYTVVNKSILTDIDREILINLYQPIVGSETISLYFTLYGYLDKQSLLSLTWTHHHLMSAMQQKLSTIINAKEKLEAIGLIKTYVKKGDINDFVYELYSPFSAVEFFSNPILSVSLFSNIGKSEYDRLVNFYKLPKISMNGYEDITCKFNDIFEIKDFTSYEKLTEELKRKNTNDMSIYSKIDLNSVLTLIPEEVFNIKSLTKDIKELIYKVSAIYNLDDSSLSNIIRNSINEKKHLDIELFKKNSRSYYQFEHEGKLPSIIFKNQPDYLKSDSKSTDKRAKLIYQMETYSPYEFLTLKNGNTRPSKNDLLLLEELLLDMNLKPGVVNVLVDYVLRINNNKLSKPFVVAIASQWKRSNIETVTEAMSFAEKEQKKHKTVKTKTTTKPDWVDKDLDADLVSQEEQKDFEELLKDFK
jgi:replication initiation and membrane attachment protein